MKQEAHGKKHVRKGTYDTILKVARTKYDLIKEVKLGKKTIISCLKPSHTLRVARNILTHGESGSPFVGNDFVTC